MDVMQLGQKMVEMVNAGRDSEWSFVEQHYAGQVVSIEGGSSDGDMPQKMEGLEAIKGKHDWWYANNEVHGTRAEGPYCGHRDDQFVLRFLMDITPKEGERMQMDEVGIFTVADDKVVQEEFLYRMG